MAKGRISSFLLILAGIIAGCSGEPSSGPAGVRWDRDPCERCRMVLSDRYHAAQVRQPLADGGSKVYRFDDFGCAVVWLDGQAWRDDPGMELWITDHRSGEWIDATTASFLPGQLTPMGYGLGAQHEPVAGGLTFEQARHRVREAENRFGLHGGHGETDTTVPPQDETR